MKADSTKIVDTDTEDREVLDALARFSATREGVEALRLLAARVSGRRLRMVEDRIAEILAAQRG
jgi:hypothetical protein